MQEILASLPLNDWMSVETIKLAPHPSDPALAQNYRSHPLDAHVALGTERLTVSDNLPKLLMAANLADARVLDHNLSRPHRLEIPGGPTLQDVEVVRDGIPLTGSPRLAPRQLDGAHEV
jgi:hypothetical protein